MKRFDIPLLLGLVVYVVVNAIAEVVVLNSTILFPPWNTLLFFSFVGPGLGILLLLVAQVSGVPRPFSGRVLFVAFVVLLLLALYNLSRFAIGSAQV